MGLFNINRKPFEANEAAAQGAAEEKWGKDALVEPVAASVGPLAVKVEVQDLDTPGSEQVVLSQQIQEIENYANRDAQANDAIEQLAVDDFIDESNGH